MFYSTTWSSARPRPWSWSYRRGHFFRMYRRCFALAKIAFRMDKRESTSFFELMTCSFMFLIRSVRRAAASQGYLDANRSDVP